jgi:nanoRNase/pAp phosphatase (c-di-AMP/oligoRNAs hydrolase)
MSKNGSSRGKLEELGGILKNKKRILILAHDNPDPDALASAFALQYLASSLWGVEGVIAHGGVIGRAENRAMVRYLKIDVRPVVDISRRGFQIAALIDTQPGAGHLTLPGWIRPEIIIDHHIPVYEESLEAAFVDIRTEYGSTSSILAEYLMESGLPSLDPEVATALLYGIKSDTRDLGRETGSRDIAAYIFLFPKVQFNVLTRIEHPPRDREYFRTIGKAIGRALIERDVVVSDLERIVNPDLLSETADMLVQLEGVKWVLCAGEFNGELLFSLRAVKKRSHAGLIAQKIVRGAGSGGGHDTTAGGRIGLDGRNYTECLNRLYRAFFQEINRAGFKGRHL